MTSDHRLFVMPGSTQASSVIPVVRSNDVELFTVTNELAPSKDNADPYLPEDVQVAVPMVPLFPLPDRSSNVVPEPSSNEYAATRPGIATGLVVATTISCYGSAGLMGM